MINIHCFNDLHDHGTHFPFHLFAAEAPSCTSSMPPDYPILEEGDAYTMQCNASYTGDPGWAPKMEWRDSDGLIDDAIDLSEEGFLSFKVERNASVHHDGLIYSAMIFFTAFDGDLPTDTADNIPKYTFNYAYDPIIVHCEF